MKFDYAESQMLSHANGYLWYANSGAFSDTVSIFTCFNYLMSFVCFYLSNIYKNLFKDTRDYQYKKMSNVLKNAGEFIRNNTELLYELSMKKDGFLYKK